MNPFAWIRSRVAEAVIAGFSDGLARIDDGTPDTRPAVEALEARLRPALPAPPEEKARPRKGGAA